MIAKTMIANYMKIARKSVNRDLPTYKQRQWFSPSLRAYTKTIIPFLKMLQGKFIDIGCGDMPFRELIKSQVSQHDSLDIEARIDGVTYINDIQNIDCVSNEKYDSAICLEVLEHIPNPFKAVSEINRILKHGARLICSVPHLSRLHEIPHDYYRYTEYGLRHLFETNGFEVLEIKSYGGLFCFIGHQISSAILLSVWRMPLIGRLLRLINRILFIPVCIFLDRFIDRMNLFPLGYICFVRKK